MVRVLIRIVLLISASITQASPVLKIQFDNLSFNHAWKDKGEININVYVEDGQTLENWQHILVYHQYPGAEKAADTLKKYLKQINPVHKPTIYQQGYERGIAGDDYTIEYLVEAPDKSYVEFNIHRFVSEAGAVHSYLFAIRNYKTELALMRIEIQERKRGWIQRLSKLRSSDFRGK